MKRYFSISLTLFVFSILNVLTYFLLGVIYGDTSLSAIFSLTYPIQFIVALLLSFFASASNIRANKEGNKDFAHTGMFLGLIFAILVFGLLAIFAKEYITFMNMDSEIYYYFTLMAIGELFFGFVNSLVTEKLYFENKDRQANLCSIGLIILNLLSVAIMALITKNQIIILCVNLGVLFVYSVIWFSISIKRFKFRFSIRQNFKYESAYIIGYVFMFIIYLFGLRRVFGFGAEFIVANNFVALITDPQWDALESAKKIAKIDISQSNYNFKRALRCTAVITMFYVALAVILYFSLYSVNDVLMKIGLIYLGLQVIDFVNNIFEVNLHAFIQLEHSATKGTFINLFGKAVRTLLTLVILSPFNTDIAQVVSGIVVLSMCLVLRFKYFKLEKSGVLVLRQKPDCNEVSASQK